MQFSNRHYCCVSNFMYLIPLFDEVLTDYCKTNAVCVAVRTPLIRDEEQLSSGSVQVLSNGSLQVRDVTSRHLSTFTCLVPLPDDRRLAVAETFTVTLQGTTGDVCFFRAVGCSTVPKCY